MLTKPGDQLVAPDPACREIENQAFLIIYGRIDLATG